MEKENELPHRTREFLRNINIQSTSSHHEQKTKLVGHVFDCLSALEQLVQLDNENESKMEGETQSVCDRNIKSLGQLVHELVTSYRCRLITLGLHLWSMWRFIEIPFRGKSGRGSR